MGPCTANARRPTVNSRCRGTVARYSICHVELVQVVTQDLSQAVVELSSFTDDACSSVHIMLQGVSDLLCGSGKYGIALVHSGGHECVNKCSR